MAAESGRSGRGQRVNPVFSPETALSADSPAHGDEEAKKGFLAPHHPLGSVLFHAALDVASLPPTYASDAKPLLVERASASSRRAAPACITGCLAVTRLSWKHPAGRRT